MIHFVLWSFTIIKLILQNESQGRWRHLNNILKERLKECDIVKADLFNLNAQNHRKMQPTNKLKYHLKIYYLEVEFTTTLKIYDEQSEIITL